MAENISTIGGGSVQASQALRAAGRKNPGTADLNSVNTNDYAAAGIQTSAKSAGTAEFNYFPPEKSDSSRTKDAADPHYFPPKTTSSAKGGQAETTTVQFSRDSDTGESLIQFVGADGKIVEQIPPKQLLDSITELWKIAGILVNKSV